MCDFFGRNIWIRVGKHCHFLHKFPGPVSSALKGFGSVVDPHRFQHLYNFRAEKIPIFRSKIAMLSLDLLVGQPSYWRSLQPLRREHAALHKTNPDQHQIVKSNPDPHQSAKTNPDPHQSEKSRIRILIKGKNRIRIRINVMRRATLLRTSKIEAPYLSPLM